jgi:hypothetical protein
MRFRFNPYEYRLLFPSNSLLPQVEQVDASTSFIEVKEGLTLSPITIPTARLESLQLSPASLTNTTNPFGQMTKATPLNEETTRGCYANEHGLSNCDDWEEGWLWLWRGRRNSIVTDIISMRGTNFAGHVSLIPKGGDEIISFGPRYNPFQNNTHADVYINVAKGVVQKDRALIVSSLAKNQLPGKLDRDCPCAAWALEAGIKIKKVKVMYSPSRLKTLFDQEHLMSQCSFCWDVDLAKKKINCITVFHVWNIVKDIPFIPMMKDFYRHVSSQSIDLSADDIQLALSKLPLAEKDLEDSLISHW